MRIARSIFHSFSVQLLLLHLRSNLLLLVFWIILVFFFTGVIARGAGAQYLFLDPEYLGHTGFTSFFWLGMAFSGFVMSWHLTVYLLSAQYFAFLASLRRPFTKFCLNNSVLPLLVFLFYSGLLCYFELEFAEGTVLSFLTKWCGFTLGGVTLLIVYAGYFQLTNRDIDYYRPRPELPPNLGRTLVPGSRRGTLSEMHERENPLGVRTYWTEELNTRLVRSVAHYDTSMLRGIFRQNHFNALIVQFTGMVLLLTTGYLIDYQIFQLPAGASLLILFSLCVALVGAITYWFDRWRLAIIIAGLIVINYVSAFPVFQRSNMLYGLDYEVPPTPYDYEQLQRICAADTLAADRAATTAILNTWRGRQAEEKPKLVIISASGGGLRAAAWAMQVVQQTDLATGGALIDHTVLITGASGGMLGMGYLRELYLQQRRGSAVDPRNPAHIEYMCRDLLNPVAFSIVSNDIFLPLTRVTLHGKTYNRDRAFNFEKQLNINTNFLLDKPLAAYREPERRADIPLLFLTPSIVNDGRRLTISPQGVSYMMIPPAGTLPGNSLEIDAVDFRRLLGNHQPDSLRFLTGLRLNATYPYVLPFAHLPTQPSLEIVDAGYRDNYGILTATRFVQVFRRWIEANTSGVVIVQISSFEKIERISESQGKGLIESLLHPLGLPNQFLTVQELEQDAGLGLLFDLLGPDNIDLVRFNYRPQERDILRASVSFHITEREKSDVLQAFEFEENQENVVRLQELLGQ